MLLLLFCKEKVNSLDLLMNNKSLYTIIKLIIGGLCMKNMFKNMMFIVVFILSTLILIIQKN